MQDVAGLAERVALRLALPEDQVDLIRHAAELHDVGKVAIPDEILSKPGPLDDARVGVHPQPYPDRRANHRRRTGARRAGGSCARPTSAGTATGYPDGLRGRGHPLGITHRGRGRLLRRHDQRAALRTQRTADAALRELRDCAGSQFDPVVVEGVLCSVERARSGALCRRADGLGPSEPLSRRAPLPGTGADRERTTPAAWKAATIAMGGARIEQATSCL